MKRGIDLGLVLCLQCHQVNQQASANNPGYCHRCGAPLFQRLPQSLSRTWALLITAAILLIPANLYPIMTVVYFGSGQPDTIMSGVVRLIQSGQYPIAILVFIASVAVPVIKILGIAFLLLVVQLRWRLSPHQCTLMYRSIEWIGRWSLLDLFMISILVTLVDLGEIATVSAGTGSTAFAGVVVLTMMSVMTFDPRLIWDLQDTKDEHDSN
ncbi:paraquat-inducible membrane protein A [Pseudomaricurvus alkylphenolicus]|uniref:paraquat-inducible protein A n=1 Tax=Pseudomaricurvus alkylphenolicus TaxID=1306991 RepID=UPI001420FCE1|nr:paraquat-inducible protein A [Pseudomaricurvus alkylphenolicus]NIB42679.1 paraquat-inducible membrane protein A [Pseudomaricurvus alkylphenolicus]